MPNVGFVDEKYPNESSGTFIHPVFVLNYFVFFIVDTAPRYEGEGKLFYVLGLFSLLASLITSVREVPGSAVLQY